MAKKAEWEWNRTMKWTIVRGMWALRIMLCMWPQYGYLHPDEFFQGVEPLAGYIFGYNVSLPWEFLEPDRPIRNILFPSISVGFPNLLMKFFYGNAGVSALSLIRVPRFIVGILSYLVDASMYFACKEIGRDPLYPLLVMNMSHVMHVYAFRTLSNTMELILFSLLLYRLVKCYASTDWRAIIRDAPPNIVPGDPDYDKEKEKEKAVEAKRQEARETKREAEDMAILFVLGFFNRPTFLFYALPGLFAYAVKDNYTGNASLWNVFTRLGMFIPAAFSFMFMVGVLDTLFYRGSFGWLSAGPVISPLNFILYNLDPANLALHGIHRPWTHMFVNLPLLFSLLPFVAIYKCLNEWIPAIADKRPTTIDRRVDYAMMASFLCPVLFLSLFRHQEPRFLIPLLFPLVFVAHDQFFRPGVLSKVLLVSWITSNALLTYFYGVMHQAGVPPLMIYVSKNMHRRQGYKLHLMSTYSYPMPQSLLKHVPRTGDFTVVPYDLGSTKFDDLLRLGCQTYRKSQSPDKERVLISMPGSMVGDHLVRTKELCPDADIWRRRGRKGMKYKAQGNSSVEFCMQKSFRPHLTTEYLPRLKGTGMRALMVAIDELRLDLFSFKCSGCDDDDVDGCMYEE